MRRAVAKLAVLCLPAVLLAGCARREAPAPAPAPPAERRTTATPSRALSSAAYVATASSIELFEIQSAELALTRARAVRVRQFAARALDAHNGASIQLSLAGRRLNLLPSANLRPTHAAMLDQLRSAANFDSAYRAQQIAVHRDALKVHQSYAAAGTSPTLRPVASAMVPLFDRELRLLRSL